MANTHGVVNTTHCSAWCDDALNYAAIAVTDIDNGTFVALGDLQKTENVIDEYTFTVTPDANGTSTIKYIVDTPIVGNTLEQQLYNDPRHFYNIAGEAMSVKQLQTGNCIEINAEAMVTGATPVDQPTYKTASIGAAGKLQMVAGDAGAFRYLGSVNRAIGQEVVPHYVFQLMA